MWARLAWVGLLASCAFRATQAPSDGARGMPDDAPDAMPMGSGSGSGSGIGSGGSGAGSGSGSGSGSGNGTLLACPVSYTVADPNRTTAMYRVVTASASWTAAEQDCQSDAISTVTGPTHLIVLDTQTEGVFAWNQNNSNQWLGETDVKTEGTILPVTDQQQFFAGGASGNNSGKDCLMTKDSSGETSADTCTTGHPYICECDGRAADPANF